MKVFCHLIAFLCACLSVDCLAYERPKEKLPPPDWARNAVIYEVNIRQFTERGKFDTFAEHLPRLKKLGVNVLWLMPIHPIGQVNRKGRLGSYYSVKNYTAINSEFGDARAFKSLVKQAHELDMRVMLDWVAHHTSHDHHWVKEHPSWHQRRSGGSLRYLFDWADTANLDYTQKDMRKAMIEAMLYWVKEFDVDGFRCDFATAVPADFWQEAITTLQKEKNLLFLAEDARSQDLLHAGFHLNYGAGLYQAMDDVVSKSMSPTQLPRYLDQWMGLYSKDSAPLLYLSNHDENSWRGALDWRFGSASDAFAVLTFTLPGIPLIYSGDEAGLDKSLEFFEKDRIVWRDHPRFALFSTLAYLKRSSDVLSEFPRESRVHWLNVKNKAVFAFERRAKEEVIQVFANLSEQDARLTNLDSPLLPQVVLQSEGVASQDGRSITIPAWGYVVRSTKAFNPNAN